MRCRLPDVWSRIGNFLNWWARIRTNADWRSDSDIWIAILALCMSASGRETTSSGRCINLPISELGKNLKLIDHWWTSGRAVEMSGRMQARTEASRYSGGSGRKDTSSGRMMLVCLASGRDEHVVRSDGTVDRWAFGWDDTSSGRLTGNLKSFIFFAVKSLLKMLWQVESLFVASLHISDFVQTQNEAKILTNSPFGHSGTKITWPVWKYIPGPKIRINHPFCHKGTKGKTK